MSWASRGFGHAASAEGADGPVGRPGAGRVHTAALFCCLLEGFQEKMLSSLWRPFLLAVPTGVTRAVLATALGAGFPAGLRAAEPLQKGILQHDREFQPPCYLRIGQLMVSAEHFSIGEANTI